MESKPQRIFRVNLVHSYLVFSSNPEPRTQNLIPKQKIPLRSLWLKMKALNLPDVENQT